VLIPQDVVVRRALTPGQIMEKKLNNTRFFVAFFAFWYGLECYSRRVDKKILNVTTLVLNLV